MLNEKVVAVRTDVDKRCGGGGGAGEREGGGSPGPTLPTWPHGPIIMPMTMSIREQRNPQ